MKSRTVFKKKKKKQKYLKVEKQIQERKHNALYVH